MPQNASKKYRESSLIYGKPFGFTSLLNVMHGYLNLGLDFQFSFFISLKTE